MPYDETLIPASEETNPYDLSIYLQESYPASMPLGAPGPNSNDKYTVFEGEQELNGWIVQSGCTTYMSQGVAAHDTIVMPTGHLVMGAYSEAHDTTLCQYSLMTVNGNAIAYNTNVLSGNVQIGGGILSSSILTGFMGDEGSPARLGTITIRYGGAAYYNDVNSGGRLWIESSGVARWNTVNSLGVISAFSSALVESTYIFDAGLVELAGGTATRTIVEGGADGQHKGGLHVSSGGVAIDVEVSATGEVHLSSAGVASGVEVSSGGIMTVQSGSAYDIKVNSGGFLVLDEGTQLGGSQVYSGTVILGAAVDLTQANMDEYDSPIKFWTTWPMDSPHVDYLEPANKVDATQADITLAVDWRTVDDLAIVNDLSLLDAPCISVRASADQGEGRYLLADGAQDFSQMMPLRIGESTPGELMVNGAGIAYNQRRYSLLREDSLLYLVVSACGADEGPDCRRYPVETFVGNVLVSHGDYMEDKDIKTFNEDLMHVHMFGSVCRIDVLSGGSLYMDGEQLPDDGVYDIYGGTATSVRIFNSAEMSITGNAVASATIVSSGGLLWTYPTQMPNFTWAEQPELAAYLNLPQTFVSNGILVDTDIRSGGTLCLNEASVLRGAQVYGGTVRVKAAVDASEAQVTFSLNQRSTADTVIVDNLAYLDAQSYTISVSSNQAEGMYRLAEGAGNFAMDVSLHVGSLLAGDLTVNGSVLGYQERSYWLTEDGGLLSLNISNGIDGQDYPVEVSRTLLLVSSAPVMYDKLISGANGENRMNVYDGGRVYRTRVDSHGTANIYEGGYAESTFAANRGLVQVAGGAAVSNIVSNGGMIQVYNGSAVHNVVSNGYIYGSNGAEMSDTRLYSNGSMRLDYQDAHAKDTIISSGAQTVLHGKAENTEVFKGYQEAVGGELISTILHSGTYAALGYKGGIASDFIVSSGAFANVYSSATLSGGYAASGGELRLRKAFVDGKVQLGGTMIAEGFVTGRNNAVLDLRVNERGTADGWQINNYALLQDITITINVAEKQAAGVYRLAEGAEKFMQQVNLTVKDTHAGTLNVNGQSLVYGDRFYSLVREGGQLTLRIGEMPNSSGGTGTSSGTSSGTSQDSSGYPVSVYRGDVLVSSAAVMYDKYISGNAEDVMVVNPTGSVYRTTIASSGSATVYENALADYNEIQYGGILTASGGTVTNNNVGGRLRVLNGYASNTILNYNGRNRPTFLVESSSAYAEDTQLIGSSLIYVCRDAIVSNTVLHSSAEFDLWWGSSFDTEIYGGSKILMNGAVAVRTTLHSGTYASGGWGGTIASDFTVSSGAFLSISSGGSIKDGNYLSGGLMRVDSAYLEGTIKLGGTMEVVTTANGLDDATIDLRLEQRTPYDDFLIDNYAGLSNVNLSINVSANQSSGTYCLAQGAEDFSQDVAISVDDVQLGSLEVNGATLYNGYTQYSLWQDDGDLYLTVSGYNPGIVVYISDPVDVYDHNILISHGWYMENKVITGAGEDCMFVDSGGLVYNTHISSGGRAYGFGYDYYVIDGMAFYEGGVFSQTTVSDGGLLEASMGAELYKTIVKSGGSMYMETQLTPYNGYGVAFGNAMARDVIIHSGAEFRVSSVKYEWGDVYDEEDEYWKELYDNHYSPFPISLSGKQVYGGTVVLESYASLGKDTELTFALEERKSSDGPIVNRFDYLKSSDFYWDGDDLKYLWDDITFNISVSDVQERGTYKLAGNAGDFSESVNLTVNGVAAGSFTPGQTINHSSGNYTLAIYDNILTLSISGVPQTVSDASPVIQSVRLNPSSDGLNFTVSVVATDDKTPAANLRHWIRVGESRDGVERESTNSGTAFTIDASRQGRTIFYQAGVSDEAGNTTWSEVFEFIAQDTIAPVLNPNGLYIDVLTNGDVEISWRAATDNIGVAGYNLFVDGKCYAVEGTSMKISGLEGGGHSCSLVAYDKAGNRSVSQTGQFSIGETLDTKAPMISNAYTTQTLPSYKIEVKGTASDNRTSEDDLVWSVRYAWSKEALASASYMPGNSFTVTSSDAARTVYIQAKVTDEAGNATESWVMSHVVRDGTPPVFDETQISVEVQGSTAKLSWSAATDNVAVAGYRILLDAPGSEPDIHCETELPGITFNDLKEGVYSFYVSAYDKQGSVSKGKGTLFTIEGKPQAGDSTFKLSSTEYAYVQMPDVTRENFTATKMGTDYQQNVWTNSIIVDAEKDSETLDNYYLYINTCWAAAASNMMVRAGWADGIFASEDAVLRYFTENFTKPTEYIEGKYGLTGGYVYAGVEWLLTGYYGSYKDISRPKSNKTGGFYVSVIGKSLDDYFEFYRIDWKNGNIYTYVPNTGQSKQTNKLSNSTQMLDKAFESLKDGKTVGLSVSWFENEKLANRTGGHVLTVYGFTYDESKKGKPGYYTGIIVADSDDDKLLNGNYLTGRPAEEMPNRMKILPIKYNSSKKLYVLDTYGSFGAITEIAVLEPRAEGVSSGFGGDVSFGGNSAWDASYSVGSSEAGAIAGEASVLTASDEVHIAVNLENEGLLDSGDITIKAVIDGDEVKSFSGDWSLLPGQSSGEIALNLGMLSAGFHDVELIACREDNELSRIEINDLFVAGTASQGAASAITIAAGYSVSNLALDGSQTLDVEAGASASGIAVGSGATHWIQSGGNAMGTVISENGTCIVESGGFIDKACVGEDGLLFVQGSASSAELGLFGRMIVTQRGAAFDTDIADGGVLQVTALGQVKGTHIEGELKVDNGLAEDTVVSSGGVFSVSSKGRALDVRVLDGGIFEIAGYASGTELVGDEALQVVSGGLASAMENTLTGGNQIVTNGGSAVDNALLDGACQTLSSGACAIRTKVNAQCQQTIFDAVAYDTLIASGGLALVQGEGLVVDALIQSGGLLRTSEALTDSDELACGNVRDIVIERGGSAIFGEGTTVYGTVSVAGTLTLEGQLLAGEAPLGAFMDDAAAILLDLNDRDADSGYLLNDIGLCGDVSLCICIGMDAARGAYLLADGGAADFDGTIAVYDEEMTYYGELGQGGVLLFGDSVLSLEASAGALSLVVSESTYAPNEIPASQLRSSEGVCTWGYVPDCAGYVLEFSRDGFKSVISVQTDGKGMSLQNLPYELAWRIRTLDSPNWTEASDSIAASASDAEAVLISAEKDWFGDVIFARPNSTWDGNVFLARHLGTFEEWSGTGEIVALDGMNQFADVLECNSDGGVLVLTDDENGDALFLDDVFTVLPDDMSLTRPRLSQLQEIRAGAGDDLIDLTSQRFACTGDGTRIYGGEGNDVIWAGKGDNKLFGDAGDDRLVGASGNDLIVGGIGDDVMHGGGGDDIFTFCGNWGNDTIEQLPDGKVTLWFSGGSLDNWDSAAFTYSDGDNSVTVTGVSSENISLKFGFDQNVDAYFALAEQGAFAEVSSEKIFEEQWKGLIA